MGYLILTKNRMFRRLMAFAVITAFLCRNMAWAAGDPVRAASAVPVSDEFRLETFELPYDLGTVGDVHDAGSDKVVIHIQDAHCNYAAQHKISDIIGYINEEYGINTVNLEGGKGNYDLAVFSDIRDRGIRDDVADHFVKRGVISGGEYFAINNPGKVRIWGVEDSGLYGKNLGVYRDSLKYKDDVDKCLGILGHGLDEAKRHIYSKDLSELDDKEEQYNSEELDLKEYCIYLITKAAEYNIEARSFPNMFKLYELFGHEREIDFDKANTERDELIGRLREILSDVETEELVLRIIDFKRGKVPSDRFYGYLRDKADSANIDPAGFPEFRKYVAYSLKYGELDRPVVMDEFDRIAREIRDAVCGNEDQKELILLDRNFGVMKNFFEFSLTREQYDYYKGHEDLFPAKRYSAFIAEKSPSCDAGLRDGPDLCELDGHRERIEKFYEYSFRRDKAFIRNLRFMSGGARTSYGERNAAILITGGFHADNLHGLFKEAGISYISVFPRFKNGDGNANPYFKLLGGYESIFGDNVDINASGIAIQSMLSEMEVSRHEKELFLRDVNRVKELASGKKVVLPTAYGSVTFSGERTDDTSEQELRLNGRTIFATRHVAAKKAEEKIPGQGSPEKPAISRLTRVFHIFLGSSLMFTTTSFMYWCAAKYFRADPLVIILIASLKPVMTYIIAVLTKNEKPQVSKLISVCMATAGIVVFALAKILGTNISFGAGAGGAMAIGIGMLVIHYIVQSTQGVFSRKVQYDKRYKVSSSFLTTLGFGMGASAALAYQIIYPLILSGVFQVPLPLSYTMNPVKVVYFLIRPLLTFDKALVFFVIVDIFKWYFINRSLKDIESSRVETWMTLVPIFTFMFSFSRSMAGLSTAGIALLAFSGFALSIIANMLPSIRELIAKRNSVLKAPVRTSVKTLFSRISWVLAALLVVRSLVPVFGVKLATGDFTIFQVYFTTQFLAFVFSLAGTVLTRKGWKLWGSGKSGRSVAGPPPVVERNGVDEQRGVQGAIEPREEKEKLSEDEAAAIIPVEPDNERIEFKSITRREETQKDISGTAPAPYVEKQKIKAAGMYETARELVPSILRMMRKAPTYAVEPAASLEDVSPVISYLRKTERTVNKDGHSIHARSYLADDDRIENLMNELDKVLPDFYHDVTGFGGRDYDRNQTRMVIRLLAEEHGMPEKDRQRIVSFIRKKLLEQINADRSRDGLSPGAKAGMAEFILLNKIKFVEVHVGSGPEHLNAVIDLFTDITMVECARYGKKDGYPNAQVPHGLAERLLRLLRQGITNYDELLAETRESKEEVNVTTIIETIFSGYVLEIKKIDWESIREWMRNNELVLQAL